MIKKILTVTIILSLVFILGCSAISGLARASSLTSASVNPIAPNAEANKAFTWKAHAGSPAIKAVTDSNERVTQRDETNNAEMVTIVATSLPDLVIESITCSPIHPSIGDTVTFTVTIKNQGVSKAYSSFVTCYMDNNLLISALVSSIDPGVTITKTFFWKAQPGSHTVKAIVDSNEEVVESDETNNEKTFTFSTLAPDLIIESITWSPESPSRGDTVTFNVAIKNQGSGRAGSSRVYFYIDDSSRGFQDVPRIDANAKVTKAFTWIAKAGFHAIKAIVDKDDQIIESDETNNEKTVPFQTMSSDLIIESIIWSPENPSETDNVTFTVIVKNQGIGKADYTFVDYYIDDDFLTSFSVNPIDPGDSANTTFNWIAEAGAHIIKAVADANDQVNESDETNNEKTVVFSPLAPDLIIEAITWSPEEPSKGDMVTFTVAVKNQGSGTAVSTRVHFYIGDLAKGYHDVGGIDAGARVEKTFTWIAKAGFHDIKAIIDKDDKLLESDENNNEKTVIYQTMSPDLIIDKITWSPESPSIGDTVTFTVTVKNQDSGRASTSYVAFYIDDAFLTSASVNSINSTATDNKTFTWIAQVGSHVIKAVADFNEKIIESDETNNEMAVTFSPLAPDLIIETINGSPVSPSIGDTVTFTVTVKNQGTDRAGSLLVDFYVDGSSMGYEVVGGIDAGATVTKTFTWTAEAGSHAIKVIVDSNDKVIENDEGNNEKMVRFPIPDLLVERITWAPGNPTIEDIVTFTVTIKNQGTDRAGSSLVDFYVDGSSAGYQDVQEIDAGATVTKTFTWTAEAGSHDIKVIADSKNKVDEDDEINNEKMITLSIPVPPDLIIDSITWSPEDPSESDNVTFTVTIKNQGSGRTDYSSVAYHIDDTYMTIDSVVPIDPGASANRTFTWTAEGGSHAMKAVVDFNNEVTETDETNNEKTVIFSVSLPPAPTPEIAPSPSAKPPEAPAGKPAPVSPTKRGIWPDLLFVLAVVILGGTFIIVILRSRKRSH